MNDLPVKISVLDICQIPLGKMSTFGYRIGDRTNGTCALIDPAFNTRKIIKKAQKDGYQITHIINTHGHSDHTAGNADIISQTGARLYIHQKDTDKLSSLLNRAFSRVLGGKGSPRPDVQLKDGDLIQFGKTRLTVLHTPGHSPGSICLYIRGHLFTGDTLFVGAVGRTDLPGGSTSQLLTSIQKKIYTLPDDTRIWPGHDYGITPWSTVKLEKETNPFTR